MKWLLDFIFKKKSVEQKKLQISKKSFFYYFYLNGYFVPDWFPKIALPNPEEIHAVKSLSVNKKCEQCNVPVWSCECMLKIDLGLL